MPASERKGLSTTSADSGHKNPPVRPVSMGKQLDRNRKRENQGKSTVRAAEEGRTVKTTTATTHTERVGKKNRLYPDHNENGRVGFARAAADSGVVSHNLYGVSSSAGTNQECGNSPIRVCLASCVEFWRPVRSPKKIGGLQVMLGFCPLLSNAGSRW